MEIHQKKAGPDYHRLKTIVKREVSSKIYEIGILAPEMEIMRRTQWSRIRRQNSVDKEFLEIVCSGKPKGSVLKETIAVSVTMSISVARWMRFTGGGGLARVPNVRVCKHLLIRGGTRRRRRMNLHPTVVPSSRRGNTSSEPRRRESR